MKTASWIIIERSTGNVVLETFNEALTKLNQKKYRAVPILEYLQSINGKNK
jgi:hypothetical protein